MLSTSVLQIVAIVTMAIDHIGLYFLPDCWPLRLIGRISFPIFCFLLVQGFKHTHSRVQYFTRLLICAIIAEIPVFFLATMTHVEYIHNILFLYALAIPTMFCVKRGGFAILIAPLAAFLASALKLDYGAFGMSLIVGLFLMDRLFGEKRWLCLIGQFVVLASTICLLAAHNEWPIQCWALLSFIPIALYSGKIGRRLPMFFRYSFYPAHLFLILFIRLAFY